MRAVSHIIKAGTRIESGQQRFLFKHEDRQEATDENFVLCKALGLAGNTSVDLIQDESGGREEVRESVGRR